MSAGESSQSADAFSRRFHYDLSTSTADFLKLPKRQRIQRHYDLGTLGPVTEFVGTAEEGEATEDLIEASRDQGFVRPTVLILCPFKKDAFDVVERLERLIFGKNKVSTWSRDRFHNEFRSEPAPVFKTRMCEEYKELITGNNDDCFRVGIAISKKVLKLFEAFDKH
ncbi:hypothetical protein TELCIR_13161 [Teladorsagia circumcincta]|uniref:UTP25 NTP hydrolase-like domain-containing protein n=1 Tax=Teladorsagia circumcincta TaxID=45464 RepID=A0A2G9U4T3_TELCI|nr:hypothetical protein TELCIR_13161 [Teladorsagia circumcincta]